MADPVRVGRRLSELVVPHLLPMVLQYLQDHAEPGHLDQRTFGPKDLEVHLVNALHGRVRLFGIGGDMVVALLTDDSALVEVADQARRTLVRLAQVRDDEGRRLAARIHGGPLQTLAAIRWDVEAARGAAPEPLATTLQRVQETLDIAENDLRAEIFALSPPSLDTTGVFVAIAELTERLRRDHRQVDVTLSGEARLSRENDTLLIRCVQELLQNVDLHANATRVHVDVAVDGEVVSVTVTDDGTGFDASDPALWLGRDHFGLASCKLLLELAGGGMWVESNLDKVGTQASCWLPQEQPRPTSSPPGQGHPVVADPRVALWRDSLSAAALRQEFEHGRRRLNESGTGTFWGKGAAGDVLDREG